MQAIVISVMGRDKPGIVDSLAKQIYANEGSWQGSSFAHMAGMFTGFVEVHVPKTHHDALISALKQIGDLEVQSVQVEQQTSKFDHTFSLEITGNDKPGIVQQLSSILNQFQLNIIEFDSSVTSAPNWGSLMFKATATVATEENFDMHALQDALEGLSDDLIVDFID